MDGPWQFLLEVLVGGRYYTVTVNNGGRSQVFSND